MRKLLPIIAIILIVWLSRGVAYRNGLQPKNPADHTRIIVQIPDGAALPIITQRLKEKDVIRSSWAFQRYVEREHLASNLQAGSFVLQPSMSVEDIVRALRSGTGDEVTITIPEGFTVQDIDRLLSQKSLITEGEFVDCARTCQFSVTFLPQANPDRAERGGRLEGYLFPDTYFVSRTSFTPKDFAERLLSTFQRKVIAPYGDQIQQSKHSLQDIVTMASLIEEETRAPQERPVVSGILWKRLDQGMRLDVDAAVRYVLNKPTASITRSDLESDSPYNLRKVKGLPPGPIANAGISSIRAALAPQQSAYFYYLHGADGQIHYAVTNDEHNANREKFLR